MSVNQANPSRVRPRSLFLPGKPALTAPQSAPAPTTTSTAIPTTTSHVSLFLTNLRLLDLDQEDDWPDITPLTFSTKDAVVGQKRRIQCVEWALYHLFVLWDEDEARNKLKPFYPPLDQVQSINLRAALLRSLEQAKRNGVLGRDAVVRKTMLDECKGERFEEVLAVFSSVVLKKLAAERALNSGPEYKPTVSERIALENWGYSGDRTELNGLLLAHKMSLSSYLTQKNAARARYQDFGELLALKERSIARRREQAKAAPSDRAGQVPNRVKTELRRTLKTNWTGSDAWVESFLYGDTGSRKDGLLATPFPEVWAGVKGGRLSDLEDQSASLLEQLDHRVRIQRARVEKWAGFRKKLFGDRPLDVTAQTKAADKKGIDFGFTSHQQLRPGVIQPEGANDFKLPPAPPEYAQLLETMKSELDGLRKPRLPDLSMLAGTAPTYQPSSESVSAQNPPTEPISDLSEWEDESSLEAIEPARTPTTAKHPQETTSDWSRTPKGPTTRQQSKNDLLEAKGAASVTNDLDSFSSATTLTRQSSQTSQQNQSAKARDRRQLSSDESTPLYSNHNNVLSPDIHLTPPPRSKKDRDSKDMPPPPLPVSQTQAMADQILASMSNASPSPIKKPRHTLSLEERTRMSMTRNKSFDPDEIDDSSLLTPTAPPTKQNDYTPMSSADTELGEEYEDLVARTRRSMVGFEAAKQKAQLERRRSQRKSKAAAVQRKDSNYFPKLDEEDEAVGDTSIVDELLSAEQDDMEAIFRSRPKMRTSPAPSPSRGWGRDSEYD